MLNYEVLSLEVDWKRLSQGLLELFFTYMQTKIHFKFQLSFHTWFGDFNPLLNC